MGKQIVTEADRRRTTQPAGTPAREGRGQAVSRERGTATRSKKHPGKRARGGG